MIEQIIQWDKQILVAMNGASSLFLDGMMMAATQTSTWVPLFVCLLYVIARNNTWQKSLLTIAVIALLVTLTDQIASGFCKPYFHRLRPFLNPDLADEINLVNGYRCGLYGFISSHASNTFGVCTFFMLLFRSLKASLLMLLWACLASYSRIYLGVHYPLDILAGAFCGILCAVGVYAFYCWLGLRLLPTAHSASPSSGYTATGYRQSDFVPLYGVFTLTLIYTAIRGILFAASS